MSTPSFTNGSTNGHASDEQIDRLYAFWPGMQTAPQPCPEAAFSLTLKGTLDGVEALLTARGQTAAEFKKNLNDIRGLLDRPTPAVQAAASQGEGWCKVHEVSMKWNAGKDGRQGWFSHKTPDGWCKGR